MYEYDYDENKVYEVHNGVRQLALDCDTVEAEFRLGVFAAEALEHLKVHGLEEYMEMVQEGILKDYLCAQDCFEHDLAKEVAQQDAKQGNREMTSMDEYMAHLTAQELQYS